ncbi:YIP1 family protein [Mitsuaria sp. WAJ17]|uniref:YIP1 family protein n=1 Tax=Mitsuaria sp. WAJ17 TaxID=2761452 RepID=UPI0015FF8DA8|nr:YIP1 family protein [Mitsuaria sp. WAJ17]MBB2487493.1 YIP1 family protein [Mitsuaria sp. WAJ17]
MNTPQLTRSMLLQPELAFTSLRAQPRFAFPLLLLVGLTLASIGAYFSQVDLAWLQTQLLAPAGDKAQEGMPALSLQTLAITSVVGALIALVGGRLMEGGYYFLAGRATRIEFPFSQWLALACWASLPLLLLPLLSMGMLVVYPSGQVLQEQLNALSLNELFFHAPQDSPWYVLLNSLSVLHPWSWWLSAVGVKTWSGRGWAFSLAFALAPWLLVYGVWTLAVGL